MRIHSIEEIPPRPTVTTALVPVSEESGGVWSAAEPVGELFPVQVIEPAPPTLVAQASSLGASVSSSYPDKSAYGLAEASVVDIERRTQRTVHVTLEGPGAAGAVLAMDRRASDVITGDAIVLQPETLGPRGIRRYLRPVDVVFAPDPDQQPWTGTIWLPILRVHRPEHAGCMATYTVSSGKSEAHSASYKFLGVGGGGDVRFDVDFEEVIEAETRCHEMAVEARATIVYGETQVGGVPVSTGYRLQVHSVDPSRGKMRDVPKHLDGCGSPRGDVPQGQRQISRDLTEVTGGRRDGLSPKFRIERSVSGRIGVDASYAKVPFSVSVGVERATRRATEIVTSLTAGASYLGYRPTRSATFELCWTVS